MLDLIKDQIGSNGKKGWPVAVRDRISFPSENNPSITESNVAVTFMWTMRDAIIPKLEKENLAIATNFYTPAGLTGMIRNTLANPYIRYLILLGEEYSSRSKDDKISDLTSANALRAFFEKGINQERKIPGFETAVHFDKNIPTELINKVRENIELIDLNKKMPDASFDEKVQEANKLLKTLEKKQPFLDKPYTFEYEESSESFPYEGGPITVHGSTIPRTWVNVIDNIYRYGRKNLMNADTDRWVKEINNIVAVIHDPQNMDLTLNPFLVPLTKEKIEAYQKEILSPLLPEGKAYTYGNKLRAYTHPSPKEIKDLVNSEDYKDFEFGKGPHVDANVIYKENICEINQIKDIIDVLKRDPYSKACIAMTWHVGDELMRKHKSSPCLALVQAMVQDEKLNLTVFFRSHDMTQGWPENAYGMAAIQKEIADAINTPSGILTIISGSAQIYDHYYQQVEDMLDKHKEKQVSFKDPRGNYLIEIKDGKIIVKLIDSENGNEIEQYEATTAQELRKQITRAGSLINFYHALYLGAELQRAELALKNNLDYTQDEYLE
jgi:thymidylate synthase